MRNRFRTPLWALAGGLVAAALPAQISSGTTAPEFEFAATWNDAPTSFAELKGKLIMLDFFATW